MDYKKLFEKNIYDTVLFNEPMKNHTTFRIGGPCEVLVEPETEEQILNVLNLIKENNLRYMVIGNGSNLLVKDIGIKGVVLKILDKFSEIKINGTEIIANSGAKLSKIAKIAIENELKGFEFASGIPGSIGGAVTMNAGAYGFEMKDVIKSVRVIEKALTIKEYSKDEMNFKYRNSKVQDDNLIVLSVIIQLEKGNIEEITENYNEYTRLRKMKQPLEYCSAGSTFKRPVGFYAGKLINDSGLRGYRYKDAQVSEKHCGFIINRGNADFEQVYTLIKTVQDKVYEKFNVMLEPEVKIVGGEDF